MADLPERWRGIIAEHGLVDYSRGRRVSDEMFDNPTQDGLFIALWSNPDLGLSMDDAAALVREWSSEDRVTPAEMLALIAELVFVEGEDFNQGERMADLEVTIVTDEQAEQMFDVAEHLRGIVVEYGLPNPRLDFRRRAF